MESFAATRHHDPDLELVRQIGDRIEACLDRVIEREGHHRDDIVACSINYYQEIPSLAFLDRIKRLNPRVLTVLGGMSRSQAERIMRLFPFVDACVFGEGEQTLVDLCRAAGDPPRWSEVAGTVSRRNGRVVTNAARPPIQGIDEIWANYEGYDWAYAARSFSDLRLPIWDSRGCAWRRCRFCDHGRVLKGFRERTPESIEAEIRHHLRRYAQLTRNPVRVNLLGSDARGSSDERFVDLLERLARIRRSRRQALSVFAELSPAHTNERSMRLLGELEATVQWGFEQWNRLLEPMGKRHEIEHGVLTLKLLDRYEHIRPTGFNLLLGYPGERFEDVFETQRNLERLRFILARVLPRFHGGIRPSRLAVTPTMPMGRGFDFQNPLVQEALASSPVVRMLEDMLGDPHGARDLAVTIMRVFNLFETGTVQLARALASGFEARLSGTSLRVTSRSRARPCLVVDERGVRRKILLGDMGRSLLEATAGIVSMTDLEQKCAEGRPEEWRKAVDFLCAQGLLFVNPSTGRCINTLPVRAQEAIGRRPDGGSRAPGQGGEPGPRERARRRPGPLFLDRPEKGVL